MRQIKIITRVPEDRLEEFMAAARTITGTDMSAETNMIAMADLDPDRASMIVFHGNELEDIVQSVNQHLAGLGQPQRLPEPPADLTPAQMQTVLDFATSLAWKRYSVEDGLCEGWQKELEGVNLQTRS